MPRYINADALAEKKFQEPECKGFGEGPAYRQGWNDAIDAITDNEPTADVQPVVRCRDCKHYAGEGMYCACDIIVHYDHFYCYHGERKDD